jgi:hypothetical protein
MHAVLQACVDCEIPRSEGLRHLEDAIQDNSEFSLSIKGALDVLSRMKRFFLKLSKEDFNQENVNSDSEIESAADDSGCSINESLSVLPDVETSVCDGEKNQISLSTDDRVGCDATVVVTTASEECEVEVCHDDEGEDVLSDEDEVYDDGLSYLGMDFGDDCDCEGDDGCPACFMICRTDNFKTIPDDDGICPYSGDPVLDCKYAPSVSFPFAEDTSETSSITEGDAETINEYGFEFVEGDEGSRIGNLREILLSFGSSSPEFNDDLSIENVEGYFGNHVRVLSEGENKIGSCFFFLGIVVLPRHVFDASFDLKEFTQMYQLGVRDYGNDLVSIKNPFAMLETDCVLRLPEEREQVFVVSADTVAGSLIFDRRNWKASVVIDGRSFTYIRGSLSYGFFNRQTLPGDSGSLVVSANDFKVIGFIKGVRYFDAYLTIVSNVTIYLMNDAYANYYVPNFEEVFDSECDEVEILSERMIYL